MICLQKSLGETFFSPLLIISLVVALVCYRLVVARIRPCTLVVVVAEVVIWVAVDLVRTTR